MPPWHQVAHATAILSGVISLCIGAPAVATAVAVDGQKLVICLVFGTIMIQPGRSATAQVSCFCAFAKFPCVWIPSSCEQ